MGGNNIRPSGYSNEKSDLGRIRGLTPRLINAFGLPAVYGPKAEISPTYMIKIGPSHTRRQLEEWLRAQIIVADAVADVGGRQLPVQDRVKTWQVQRYDILDLPEHDLNLEWDLTELYDIAFCLETFEFIYDPFQAMKNLHRLLKKGGVLYASFHFLYPHHGPQKGVDCLRYTRWGIEKLLDKAGFSEWQVWPRKFNSVATVYSLYLKEGMFRGVFSNLSLVHREQGHLIRAVK